MQAELVHYAADGLAMAGRLYRDPARVGARPGVLVFPDAMGISGHTTDRAMRLAERGYVALACDLHGDGRYTEDLAEVMELLSPLQRSPERMRSRARGAFDLLLAQGDVDGARVAAIGYCIGGGIALELARDGAELAGAVAFHGQITTSHPDGAAHVRGKVLLSLGADDPYVPLKHRLRFEEEMRDAGVDWRMHLYGGVVHSFTIPGAERHQPDANRYDPGADKRSWKEMLDFLDEIFA